MQRTPWTSAVLIVAFALIFAAVGIIGYAILRDDNTELRNHLHLIEEQNKGSRYLLCQIADGVDRLDASPQPCIVNGHPVGP